MEMMMSTTEVETDMTTEEFMAEAGLSNVKPEPKKNGRAVKKELLEGELGEPVILPETVTQETIKLMKTVSITRRPSGRIAEVELRVKDGTLYNLTIDEATARAIASVFD
jgi:hypothetical protein